MYVKKKNLRAKTIINYYKTIWTKTRGRVLSQTGTIESRNILRAQVVIFVKEKKNSEITYIIIITTCVSLLLFITRGEKKDPG